MNLPPTCSPSLHGRIDSGCSVQDEPRADWRNGSFCCMDGIGRSIGQGLFVPLRTCGWNRRRGSSKSDSLSFRSARGRIHRRHRNALGGNGNTTAGFIPLSPARLIMSEANLAMILPTARRRPADVVACGGAHGDDSRDAAKN